MRLIGWQDSAGIRKPQLELLDLELLDVELLHLELLELEFGQAEENEIRLIVGQDPAGIPESELEPKLVVRLELLELERETEPDPEPESLWISLRVLETQI